ncbi:MAG: leucine-rich repeat domain-containing protein [Salinivirgaceae bacterium]|nr:leucine-rich repeat domain-containing protein [Salinivirgaceae bacterium]
MRLTLISIIALIILQGCGSDRFCDGFFYYKITSDTTVSITYRNKRNNYATYSFKGTHKMLLTVEIPEYTFNKGEKYKVTSIGEYAFWNSSNIKKVIIPNTCTVIDSAAFGLCNNLIDIKIPKSIKEINDYAFMNCEELISINIPDSITKINKGCFFCCKKLNSITIPTNIKSIEKHAFALCDNLKYVYIPSSVINIDNESFYQCKKAKFYCEPSTQPTNWDKNWKDEANYVEWNNKK